MATHAVVTRNLGRSRSWRKATVRSLTQALIKYERIETTLARAKEAQRLAERLVTLGKEGSLSARRHAVGMLDDSSLVAKLFSDVAPRFSTRQGGYTRVIHGGYRPGDGASTAVLEWTEPTKEVKPVPPSKTKEKEQPRKTKGEAPPEPKPEEAKKPPEEPKGFLAGLRKLFKRRPKS